MTTTAVFHGLPNQIRTTLSMMNEFICHWSTDENVIKLARFIVRGCRGAMEEAETVRAWVRSNIEYRNDPAGAELLQDPIVTLAEQAGDCDDLATLAGALLGAIGHDTEALAITWQGRTDPSHAVIMDKTVGGIVDPVSPVHVAEWPPVPFVVSKAEGA